MTTTSRTMFETKAEEVFRGSLPRWVRAPRAAFLQGVEAAAAATGGTGTAHPKAEDTETVVAAAGAAAGNASGAGPVNEGDPIESTTDGLAAVAAAEGTAIAGLVEVATISRFAPPFSPTEWHSVACFLNNIDMQIIYLDYVL